MVKLYDSVELEALDQLLDPRNKAATIEDMYATENVTDGLLCWVSSLQQLFVYSSKIEDWIQLPIVIPTKVNNPLNGSSMFDTETKQQLVYFDGYWYNPFGEIHTGKITSNKYYLSNIDKVINTDTGESLRQILNGIYDMIASLRSANRLTNESKTKSIITQDGLRIII